MKSDFDFAAGIEQWNRLTPEEQVRSRAVFTHSSGSAEAAYSAPSLAVVSGELTEGAVAYAIREIGLPYPRLILISSRMRTDRAVLLGAAALLRDEELVPVVRGRRMLAVSDDGKVLDENGRIAFKVDM